MDEDRPQDEDRPRDDLATKLLASLVQHREQRVRADGNGLNSTDEGEGILHDEKKRAAEQLSLLAKLLADEGGWGQHYIDACEFAARALSESGRS